MKNVIIAVASLMVAVSAFGQGEVNFNNRVTGVVDARVIEPGGAGVGAGYTAQLFGGPAGTAAAQLTALTPTTTFRTSSAAAQGYLNGVTVAVPGVPSGANAALQMRVFQGATEVGSSSVITIALGGGTLPPSNLAGLAGLSGPTITVVPEPSTIALGALGLAALLLRRRK